MTEKRQDEMAEGGVRPCTAPYMAWLEEAKHAERALHAWLDAPPRDEAALYAAYRAALDREEAAAADLERLSGPGGGAGGDRVVGRIVRHRYATPIVRETAPRELGG